MVPLAGLVFPLIYVAGIRAQTYSATYLPSKAPNHSEDGQSGTNQCGTTSNQSSQCQNAYLNSANDFCLFAPPDQGPGSLIGNTEQIEVSWCLQPGYGTRVIPDGTISGAHFVQTPDYVQITGVGDLTKINIPLNDGGGELDPHGADGNGNPVGGLVFSTAFGALQQIHEWTNFVAYNEFCFRACKPGPNATTLCQHIYDELGCMWNMPGNYNGGSFENCLGDTGEPMGVYDGSTFHQGDPATPSAHPAPSSYSCTPFTTIGSGLAVNTSTTTSASTATSSGTHTPAPASTTVPPSVTPSKSATQNGSAITTSIAGWPLVAAVVAFSALQML